MHITISKVKLTKSTLNQLPYITAAQRLTARPLGYVLNCRKAMPKCLILTDGHTYFVMRMGNWKPCDSTSLSMGKGRYVRTNSTKERDDWLNQYKSLTEGTEQLFL